MGYESELSKKDIQRLINKGKSTNPIEAIKKKKKKKALMAKLKKALPYFGAGTAALIGYGVGANKDKIKAVAGKVSGKVKGFGSSIVGKFGKKKGDVEESAVDYVDNLLDTFYEAYYYDLLDDAEYEAFVESVYEADDLDEISDIETVFESYIE